MVEGDGAQGIPYEWDDKLDVLAHEEAPSVKMGAICISNSVAAAWLAGLVASQPRLQVASNHNISQAIATLIASQFSHG